MRMEIIYPVFFTRALANPPIHIYIYIQYIETMYFHLAIFCNLLVMLVLSDPKSKVKGDQPNDWGLKRSRVTWITWQLWFPYTSTYNVHRYHIYIYTSQLWFIVYSCILHMYYPVFVPICFWVKEAQQAPSTDLRKLGWQNKNPYRSAHSRFNPLKFKMDTQNDHNLKELPFPKPPSF